MSLRFALLALLVSAAWAARPPAAQACKCMPQAPSEAFADASAVFEGRVLSISAPIDAPVRHLEVTLAVVRAWKGIELERVTVHTAADGAACGYAFANDTSYLVYARESEGVQRVTSCSRTRPIAEAEEDLRAIGMGQTPVDPKADPLPEEPEDEPPAQGGCASCAVGAQHATRASGCRAPATSGALALAALARLTSRRRSRSRS